MPASQLVIRPVLVDEEPLQSLRGNMVGNAFRVDAQAGHLQGIGINVRSEHLKPTSLVHLPQFLVGEPALAERTQGQG